MQTKSRTRSIVVWTAVAAIGAVAWGVIALVRGEQISAAWLIAAAVGSYAIAYRFYARFITRKVLETNDKRATPAERLENDQDFQPTDRRVLFGHHIAAIAGAGPLVGPVLAAQMGYLPGTIWIVVGVIFAGAVQDMVTLFFSMRRDGKSLGQMAREEIGPVGGVAALIAVFSIIFGVVPEAISAWKPDRAPQAIVMNTNGNSAPAKTGPSPEEANLVTASFFIVGSVTRMPTASSMIVPIFMKVDR